MARLYSTSGGRLLTEELTLNAAAARNLTWDVFVSHTTDDDALAETVANCIQSFGLTAWVDSHHLAPNDDEPAMASKIKHVIERSYCLLAVVTSATKESWWVPFEIGVASEKDRFLSTYSESIVSLPSFLAAWPRVKGHGELHQWCNDIKSKKDVYGPTILNESVDVGSSQRSNYAAEMRAMAQKFPYVR